MKTQRLHKGALALAIIGLWIGSASVASATSITIHQSTETYFSNGGTSVSGCIGVGCPSQNFTVGNATGTDLWTVQEKVFQDAQAGTTTFSYTIFNDGLTGDPITSFHMLNSGNLANSSTAPTSWTFSQNGTGFTWSTTDRNAGIFFPNSLNTMTATFNTLNMTVIFTGNTGYDRTSLLNINSGVISQPNWVVSSPSTVPEPSSLLLLGSGMVGLWSMRRRRAIKQKA